MGSVGVMDDVWREVDNDKAWVLFNERFEFAPNYYERATPAIELPTDSVVIDLSPIVEHSGARFAAGIAAISSSALRAFVWLADDDELIALDWQHHAYRYKPGEHALSTRPMVVPVFPDGDYVAHMKPDLRWGTVGHPWQRTLTIWGDDLIATLGTELLTWLPRHPQSRS